MQETGFSPAWADYRDDFICRVLNQFFRWGIKDDSILDMLEESADNIERLEIIEDCLSELSRFQIEPDYFLWQIASDDLNNLIQDASIAVECKDLLDELDEIRCKFPTEEYEPELMVQEGINQRANIVF